MPPCEIPALFDDELLEILCCPLDHSLLTQAEPSLVEQVNQAITAGQVVNLAGQTLEKTLDSGLLRAAGDVLYSVVDGIPVLLPDEAIALSQLDEGV